MSEPTPSFASQQLNLAVTACKDGWHVIKHRGPGKVTFWFIALIVGIAAGFAAYFSAKGSIGYRPLFMGPRMCNTCIPLSAGWIGTGSC